MVTVMVALYLHLLPAEAAVRALRSLAGARGVAGARVAPPRAAALFLAALVVAMPTSSAPARYPCRAQRTIIMATTCAELRARSQPTARGGAGRAKAFVQNLPAICASHRSFSGRAPSPEAHRQPRRSGGSIERLSDRHTAIGSGISCARDASRRTHRLESMVLGSRFVGAQNRPTERRSAEPRPSPPADRTPRRRSCMLTDGRAPRTRPARARAWRRARHPRLSRGFGSAAAPGADRVLH